jgi:hypothetical protein
MMNNPGGTYQIKRLNAIPIYTPDLGVDSHHGILLVALGRGHGIAQV